MKETTMISNLRPVNDKDIEYANRFFTTAPKGMKETIAKTIRRSVNNGEVVLFATIKDREKLSAYRVTANEIGIVLGQWLMRSYSGTATARINNFTGLYNG